MTLYATHRFSVGQRVVRFAETSTPCEVLDLIDGSDGPEYRIKSDGHPESVVGRGRPCLCASHDYKREIQTRGQF